MPDHGLDAHDFEQIAQRGFGDPLNAYAHTMAWFKRRLYVGTTRANLCLRKMYDPPKLSPWPVACPDDVYDLDLRAQIWSYDPCRDEWERVYQSPWIVDAEGRRIPRDLGYRGITTLDDELYISTWSPSRGPGALILRSTDGANFTQLSKPGVGYPATVSFRSLVAFDGRLFTSPSGRPRGQPNASDLPVVLECTDPDRGIWEQVSEPGFGDPDNLTVFELQSFDGHLYAGTFNPTTGCEVWKTRARGRRPYRWTKVLDRGAGRGPTNEGAISLCPFDGTLYVGTGIQGGGHDQQHGIGPAAAELIRIRPDDSWDLVVGAPRQTQYGFKPVLSGLRPGFDNFFSGYVWRLCAHAGWLYAGTFDNSVFLPYVPLQSMRAENRAILEEIGVDNIVRRNGGFDLWRSRDGVRWQPVTRTGFDNPFNCGLRTLVSSPHGLFLGTANPFGPRVAVSTPTGWTYATNPRGGLEVWLGRAAKNAPDDLDTPQTRGHGQAQGAAFSEPVNRFYDRIMFGELDQDFYEGSGFQNFGYWSDGARTMREACEDLMEQLLATIPVKSGRILDVACGRGATTHYLLRYYRPEAVTGINISEAQLRDCRYRAPACRFLLMSATDLDFPSDFFDAIICVEAAFHFNTREQFLREALRVLKPGGRLALSDILLAPAPGTWDLVGSPDNYVTDIDIYADVYRRVGFRDVQVTDATEDCWEPFVEYALQYLDRHLAFGRIGRWSAERMRQIAQRRIQQTHAYLLVSARKRRRRRQSSRLTAGG